MEIMSDAAVTVVVAGFIQIAGMLFGFLTLWLKVKDSVGQAKAAATAAKLAASAVELKLDSNTATTVSVDKKADTIVRQTNGALESTRQMVQDLSVRVVKLEEYAHQRNHEILSVLQTLTNRVGILMKLVGGTDKKGDGPEDHRDVH